MSAYRIFILVLLLSATGCGGLHHNYSGDPDICICDSADKIIPADKPYSTVKGALLGSRFNSLDDLKSVVRIEYFNDNAPSDSTIHKNSKVCILQCSDGMEAVAVLEAGVNQGDISKAKYGTTRDRLALLLKSPYVISNRKDFERVYLLARMRPSIFGEGDVAFFNLAQTMARNINTPDIAFINPRDSSEKGYLNTFNHITAQAFITTCFSEELADFVGDAHERYFHPDLINGKFSNKEAGDLAEGPVDNYVDIINNEWGQELGKQLKKKYSISRKTNWTPELLSDYLNDLQNYYSWALQVGFNPFRPEDEQVVKFSRKLNIVMSSRSFGNY